MAVNRSALCTSTVMHLERLTAIHSVLLCIPKSERVLFPTKRPVYISLIATPSTEQKEKAQAWESSFFSFLEKAFPKWFRPKESLQILSLFLAVVIV